MSSLVKYEAARVALAAATSVDEVKDLRNKAEAMAAYARQARDTELIQYATEIKVRAERRVGEMSLAMETSPGKRSDLTSSHDATRSKLELLTDAGITKQEANRYEQLAKMPEEHFETAVATAKETAGQVTSAHMLREAKKSREPAPKAAEPESPVTPEAAADAKAVEQSSLAADNEQSSPADEHQDDLDAYVGSLQRTVDELRRENASLTVTDRDGEIHKLSQQLLHLENRVADLSEKTAAQRRNLDWFGARFNDLRKLTGAKIDRDVVGLVRKLVGGGE